jgi:ABC-type Na+ efflux pump permease subunit
MLRLNNKGSAFTQFIIVVVILVICVIATIVFVMMFSDKVAPTIPKGTL